MKFKILVAENLARDFFNLALDLLGSALNVFLIHDVISSSFGYIKPIGETGRCLQRRNYSERWADRLAAPHRGRLHAAWTMAADAKKHFEKFANGRIHPRRQESRRSLSRVGRRGPPGDSSRKRERGVPLPRGC